MLISIENMSIDVRVLPSRGRLPGSAIDRGADDLESVACGADLDDDWLRPTASLTEDAECTGGVLLWKLATSIAAAPGMPAQER